MKKEYLIRSDIASQKRNLKKTKEYVKKNIKIKLFKKEKFNYTNLIYKDISTRENQNNLKKIFQEELKKYLNKYKILKNSTIFIVGLGNAAISSDSVGVKIVNKVKSNNYISLLNLSNRGYKVATFIPNTTYKTGIETTLSIKALTKLIKPDLVILIDAYLSSNIKYLNHLVEINDEGITPGSGIFNYQKEINSSFLNTPVLIVGIPTVIEASTIISNVLGNKKNKVLFHDGYDLLVSSKDIDYYLEDVSNVISEGLSELFKTI